MVQDTRAPTVFVVSLVLSVLATVFVALRLISKGIVMKKLTTDDLFTVIAWVFATALSIAVMVGTRYGLGNLDQDIPPEWEEPLKRAVYAFTVFYNPALMATKTAILILYRRMAAAHPFLRYASIATMVVVNIAGVVLTFLSLFQCRPIQAAFEEEVNGQCIDVVSLYLSSAPINILTDLAILILPLPILTGLRMEFRQKVALVCTFIVGGFVTIVDVVRIIYLQNALRIERDHDGNSATITAAAPPVNFTYNASFSLMWSSVEVSVGLMCCCVLVLKPLVMKLIPNFFGRQFTSRRGSKFNTGAVSSPDSLLQTSDISSKENGQMTASRPTDSNISTNSPLPITPTLDHTILVNPPQPPTDPLATKMRSPKPPALEMIPETDMLSVEPEEYESERTLGDGSGMNGYTVKKEDNVGTPGSVTSGFGFPTDRDDADDDSDDGMDFFQMLAADPPQTLAEEAPPIDVTKPRRRSIIRRATLLNTRRPSPPTQSVSAMLEGPTQNFFDFVNMKGKQPLTQLSAREAWWPIMFVSILFFLWGFAYGLLGTLNAKIQSLLEYDASATFALHNAYWIGYFLGPPLIGYWTITREGFKATFMTGLAIYATGVMAFWPSSVLLSYGGFFISNVLVAVGLSVLENAANPFIALAGPGHLSEVRLCFSQGIQGIGSIISPILANRALFTGINGDDIFRVQWCYLAIALFVVLLAVVFFYVPLSEADNDELEAMAVQRLYNADLEMGDKAYGIDARKLLFVTGIIMMSIYVGAQESVSYFWGPTVSATYSFYDPGTAQDIGHGVFAFGRFLAAGMCYIIPPRHVLLITLIGSFITSILSLVIPSSQGALGFLILVLFFEAPIFPLIFAMTLRGQGKHTKLVATGLTMAICGGAIWPSVTYGVIVNYPNAYRPSIIVSLALYAITLFWPLMLSFNGILRRWIDPIWSYTRLAGGGTASNTENGGHGDSNGTGLHRVPWDTQSEDRSKNRTTHVDHVEVKSSTSTTFDLDDYKSSDTRTFAAKPVPPRPPSPPAALGNDHDDEGEGGGLGMDFAAALRDLGDPPEKSNGGGGMKKPGIKRSNSLRSVTFGKMG